jgi:APA family basic amino acid/polyamine antiporter
LIPARTTPVREESLVRAIGTLGLAAVIVNITIGAGIFRLPSNVAASLGSAAPLAYLVCAVAMGLIVFCIADAGSRVSLTGGPYAYVAVALGPFAGFISGVLLWLLGTFAASAVATVFAASVGLLVPLLSGRVAGAALLAGALVFWSAVNIRGVSVGTRLNSIVTAAKLAPLLLIALGGIVFVRADNLAWTTPAAGDVARMSLLLIFAFAGIEVALVPSGEVRDPARTVPRAIALAMAGITVLYVLLQVVAQGILGDALAAATVSPLADAAGASLGAWASAVLLLGASISTFGHMGGVTLSMPRIVYAFARDGYLPRALGAIHPRSRAPHVAIVVQSAVTLVLAVSGSFEKLAMLANLCALALYLGCAIAARRLRSTSPRGAGTGGVDLPFAGAIPWLACAVILWLLTGVTRDEWLAFTACIVAASLLYAAATWRRVVAHPK